MGKIIRFDPRRKRKSSRRGAKAWTRAEDYGARPAPKAGKRRSGSTWREAWHSTRPLVLLIFLVTAIVVWREPQLVGAPDFLATDPQVVEGEFALCGPGRSRMCVVDGDTFRMGLQSIRVLGFDAPEAGEGARCEAEARAAERATRGLQDWLNAGAFTMQGRWDEPTDRYGRLLRELYRVDTAGERQWVGDALVGAGLARRYYGGARGEWC